MFRDYASNGSALPKLGSVKKGLIRKDAVRGKVTKFNEKFLSNNEVRKRAYCYNNQLLTIKRSVLSRKNLGAHNQRGMTKPK